MATAALATPVAKSPKEFHLKTAGASNAKFNDLFVYAYHTGAGFNDAVLSKDNTIASAFYFNGTMALADLKTEFPWGMIAPGDANYACKCEPKRQERNQEPERSCLCPRSGNCRGSVKRNCTDMVFVTAWEPILINAGSGTEGFSIDKGNFVWSKDYGFGGWLGK